jgi:hypothetical protein
MPKLVKEHAREIAKKLARQAPMKPRRQRFTITEREGRKHTVITVFYGSVRVGAYGIKRSPDRNAGHMWIADQIHLSPAQALDFAECGMTVDQYIDILVEKGQIVR